MFCFEFSVTFRFHSICVVIVPARIVCIGTKCSLNLFSLYIIQKSSHTCDYLTNSLQKTKIVLQKSCFMRGLKIFANILPIKKNKEYEKIK